MQDVPVALAEFAAAHGEPSVIPAGGVKSAVAIGRDLIFKVVETGKPSAADLKEQRVLHILAERLPDPARALVPQTAGGAMVEGVGFVEVQRRLRGVPAVAADERLCADLGRFLRDLHGCAVFDAVTEFEDEQPQPFLDYLRSAAVKFRTKLAGFVSGTDLDLVDGAVAAVDEYVRTTQEPPELVLVHKDISLANLLVSGSELSGVVDWAAAQTAPREWEIAIVEQRLGAAAALVRASYGHRLDADLIRVCGALQAIRFWKSFPDDAEFVDQQRALLRQVL